MELEKNVKNKMDDRITNDEVFQRAKEEMLLLKILKIIRQSWIGHIMRHNEFVVNILEGAISGKKKKKSEDLDYNTYSCQPIKRLKDKKKIESEYGSGIFL
jgi:hypothetical protein